MQSTKIHFRNDKKKVDIQQPNFTCKYNAGMGGVDLMERMFRSYRLTLLNIEMMVKSIC